MLIGSFIATMLYGVTTLQVAVVWVYINRALDTLHSVFMVYSVYFYLVVSYYDPTLLAADHWSLNIFSHADLPMYDMTVSFLCPKKYRFWVTSIIGLAVFAHFAFGVEVVILMFIRNDLAKLSDLKFIAAVPFAIFAVLSDTMIAGALCYFLHDCRSEVFSKRANSIISILIIYAVNRCLLTSAVTVAELTVFFTLPTSLWVLAIDSVVGKCQ
ncbi:hypothetical protein HYPSUDRAFT_52474 [Hypholoma sublateritium FD-334 SS-4]|uniref:DUF6534 domain-containing protein n=1 Tax=Hypholoma sublateritium (strain FD-334 SS-4) TaxID=945553 RepID=A0A0D2P6Q1_HYPSF|nr:hypothetical protein HYPSUDRAFT_52474 [Hypholoma sublateritium FD-334 SS-4]